MPAEVRDSNWGYYAGEVTPWAPTPPTQPAGGGAPVRGIDPRILPGQLPGNPLVQILVPGDVAPVTTVTAVFASGTPLVVRYLESGASGTTVTEGLNQPPLEIYLGAGASGPLISGSLRFTFRGRTYVDRSGSLYYGVSPTTNAGTLGGTVNYSTNVVTLTDYVTTGSNTVNIISMGTRMVNPGITGVMFRTPGSPLRIGSFTIRATGMDGTEITASADVNGDIVGTLILGTVDWQSGLCRITFGESVVAAGNETQPWYDPDLVDGTGHIWKPYAVDPTSVFFGTVIYRSIPVDPNLVGIDPVRLPSDGRVLGFNIGTPAVISHTQVTSVASPIPGHLHTLRAGGRIAYIEVHDSLGVPIAPTWYTIDLDAGTLTWANPLNLSAYTLPAIIRDRIQDTALITDVQVTGEIALGSAISHDYPDGTTISNALAFGDMQSRVSNIFDQETYDPSTWSDVVQGDPAGSSYNNIAFPITTTNEGAVDDRIAIVFTSALNVRVIFEKRGQIATATITDDIAPVNPVTGVPYFFIDKDGWGSGWAAGNMLRFNLTSCQSDFWAARVTLPGEITEDDDSVRINAYGNAN